MATAKGLFDTELVIEAWFGEGQQLAGWFDDDLIDTSSGHSLTATGIVTGAPSVGAPAVGQIHVLTADGIAIGAPLAGAPALGQVHGLVAVGVATAAPGVGGPTLSESHSLTATGIATLSPPVENPVLGQTHAITATGAETGAPSNEAPMLGQAHGLVAAGVETGAVVDAASLGQAHALNAVGLAVGSADLGTPELMCMHELEAFNLYSFAPFVESASLGVDAPPAHADGGGGGGSTSTRRAGSGLWVKISDDGDKRTVDLASRSIATPQPIAGAPSLVVAEPIVYDLSASHTVAAFPSMARPPLVQIHQLRPQARKHDDLDEIMRILAMIDTLKKAA